MNRFLSLIMLLLLPVLALGQSNALVDGVGFTQGYSTTNFVKNFNAQKNVANVTSTQSSTIARVQSATATLYSTTEFSITDAGQWDAVWAVNTLTVGMKNRLCEVQMLVQGTVTGTTSLKVKQNSVDVFVQDVSLIVNATNPSKIGSTFPCGDLTYASTIVLEGSAATTALKVGKVYLGAALSVSPLVAPPDGTGIKLKSSTNADLMTISETGAAEITATSGAALIVKGSGTTSATSNQIWRASDTTTLGYVENGGAWNVGASTTATNPNQVNGSLKILGYSTSSSSYVTNISNDSWTLATSGTPEYTLSTGGLYGLLLVSNLSTGAAAMYMLSNADGALVSDPSSQFGTAEATANKVNVYYSSGWKVKNRIGADRICSFTLIGATSAVLPAH